MGRAPCCEKQGVKKGPWAPEEDKLLLDYIQAHGCGNWRSLPRLAGLLRCGKSCRLRWTNYLRPDIKRGAFTEEEEKSIVQLHAIVGNKWSTIAANIQGRTDNEIKNYWNTHLKKRLLRMGIVLDTYTTTQTTTTTTRHMAQWESARLEAEARLSQESLLSSTSSSSAATNATNSSSLPSPPNPSPVPVPVDFFLRIWNSPTGDAFRKPVTSTSSCATAAIPPPPPPHTSSQLLCSNVTTSNEATGAEEITSEEEEEEEEEDSYRLYFDFAAGDDLGFFQGQMGSCCYSSLLADLNEASLDTAFK